jgi:DNA (cytosine-5)-methyltransferase 1
MQEIPDLTVAEYFAGIGLMRLGLDQAGWRTTFANDIEETPHVLRPLW